jgi:hypothetical protein
VSHVVKDVRQAKIYKKYVNLELVRVNGEGDMTGVMLKGVGSGRIEFQGNAPI